MSKNKKLKVVLIAGGNGSANSLVALKRFTYQYINLKAIVPMSDSGGSSGKLRKELRVLPPGDILRAILALSETDYLILKKIFYQTRFENLGRLSKHNLGNLFLALSAKFNHNNFYQSCQALSQAVGALGEVYPASVDYTNLVAQLNNGEVIEFEHNIDKPKYNKQLNIEKVWLKPQVKIFTPAFQALIEADYVFFGPGSLYTSIIASILPQGFKTAFKKTKAKLIYIFGNIRHLNGETGPRKFSQFVKELENYIGRELDFIIYNSHVLNDLERQKYQLKKWQHLDCDDYNLNKPQRVIKADFERYGGGLCPDRLSEVLKQIMLKK